MTLLNRKQIEALALEADGPRVSIYLPTHRAGHEAAQDPIRFKNLLIAAEEDLMAHGVRPARARDMLEPARALLENRYFWIHQGDGLAVFVSSEGIRAYRLPIEVPELELVADHYHVKPLIELLSGDGRFYVLALSLSRVRLFEASRDSIRELDLEDIPESLLDAVGYDWEQSSLQFHTGAPGSGAGGARPAMFHGHGSPSDDRKEEIETFLKGVDGGVAALLGDDRVPLVLAGVDYVTAIYRSITHYPQVLDSGVRGNPDHLTPEELRTAAWPLVKPRLLAGQQAALTRFERLAGTGQASADVDEVLRAAFGGRVETLVTASGVQRWGTFDEQSNRAEIHPERRPGDRDLVDLAVVHSLASGAEVYAVKPEALPGRSAIAATFRF